MDLRSAVRRHFINPRRLFRGLVGAALSAWMFLPTAVVAAERAAESSAPDAAISITFGVGGLWKAVGASPAFFGQAENLPNDNPVVGAIHTVAAHPSNSKVLYVGAVNGGVWRTLNADAPSPNWKRLTDDQSSNSIGALEFDPTDPTRLTRHPPSSRRIARPNAFRHTA